MIKKAIISILKKRGYTITKIPKIDTFIISFPKSGRTWLNLMLGKFFEQHVGLNNLDTNILFNLKLFNDFYPEKVPLITFSHDNNVFFYSPPHKIKSNINKYKNSKVIFLSRNPIDVLVSSYFEKTKRIELGQRKNSFWKPFKGTISDYIYEKNGGIDTIIAFYNMWEKHKDILKDNIIFINYESLQINTADELNKIVKFIGLKNIEQKHIETAVNFTKFENMQKIEKNSDIKTNKLKPVNKNDVDTFKTRRGKINGYIDYFSEEEINYLISKINKNLSPFFGYNK